MFPYTTILNLDNKQASFHIHMHSRIDMAYLNKSPSFEIFLYLSMYLKIKDQLIYTPKTIPTI